MKVLFVSSGNSKFGISPIIKNQGESLKYEGMDVDYFTINGKGPIGYLKNIPVLKKYLKYNKYDFIHAHFSLSGYVAAFAGSKPLAVSLMGSDVNAGKLNRFFIRLFKHFFWDLIIVKSQEMKETLDEDKVEVIPNGVNLNRFKELNKNKCQEKLGWKDTFKHILFTSNPDRFEKNFSLTEQAVKQLHRKDVQLHILDEVTNEEVPIYLNASDTILLTSHWEGSPNIIKEAMACNCPIVTVNVGDVKDVISDTNGCYICSHDATEITARLKEVLSFNKRTNGRNIIKNLDSRIVAQRILSIYQKIITENCIENTY